MSLITQESRQPEESGPNNPHTSQSQRHEKQVQHKNTRNSPLNGKHLQNAHRSLLQCKALGEGGHFLDAQVCLCLHRCDLAPPKLRWAENSARVRLAFDVWRKHRGGGGGPITKTSLSKWEGAGEVNPPTT